MDYFLTFYFAPSIDAILKYEYSPILLFALEHNIVVPYVLAIMFFYYFAGRFVLEQLAHSEVYWVGAMIICTISITHVLGGFSWYVLNESYSNFLLLVSRGSVVVSIAALGYTLIKQTSG